MGNFIFQNDTLVRQPADFYAQWGLGAEADPLLRRGGPARVVEVAHAGRRERRLPR